MSAINSSVFVSTKSLTSIALMLVLVSFPMVESSGQVDVDYLFIGHPLQAFGQAPNVDGGIFSEFGVPTIGNDGTVAFEAELQRVGSVGSGNDTGIWAGLPDAVRLVGREGDPAPTFEPPLALGGTFSDPTVANSGEFGFLASLSGEGAAAFNNGVFYLGSADELARIIREGDLLDDSTFSNFSPTYTNGRQVNEETVVTYQAGILRYTGEGIQAFVNDQAVGLVEKTGPSTTLTQVIRLGDSIPGATIPLTLGNSSIPERGERGRFNHFPGVGYRHVRRRPHNQAIAASGTCGWQH